MTENSSRIASLQRFAAEHDSMDYCLDFKGIPLVVLERNKYDNSDEKVTSFIALDARAGLCIVTDRDEFSRNLERKGFGAFPESPNIINGKNLSEVMHVLRLGQMNRNFLVELLKCDSANNIIGMLRVGFDREYDSALRRVTPTTVTDPEF